MRVLQANGGVNAESNKKEEVWVVEKRKRMNEQMEKGLNIEWEDRGQRTGNGEENEWMWTCKKKLCWIRR